MSDPKIQHILKNHHRPPSEKEGNPDYGGTPDAPIIPDTASATGGNAFARDLLAGISAMYATPMYTNIGDKWHIEYASTVLACLSCLVVIPIYVFYWKGPQIRASSKFAQALEAENKTNQGRRVSRMNSLGWGSV
ncbi:hypothetical protein BDW67DRAFT_187860 [Aspergillus spinulosporus]